MKRLVITGASKGIGKAIAEKFCSQGFDIAVCSRSQENLALLKKELLDIRPDAEILTIPCDMSVKNDVLKFGTLISEQWGSFDVLVNNAGIFYPGNLMDEEDGKLEKMMDTNLFSAYHLTRKLLPDMIKQKDGHIINICSIASLKAYPAGGSYGITKFALLGFSKALREELKNDNIRVTSVMPGATLTDSWAGTDLPESRFMKAEDVAEAIWSAYAVSKQTVIEDLVLRPQLGDI